MNIELFPLEKVMINGQIVYLGMSKTEVDKLIGVGEHVGDRFYYFNSNMAIDFDANNNVEYIEFLAGIDGELHPSIYGIPVFETNACELCNALQEKNGGQIDEGENGYSYCFTGISVGVYRERVPEDVEEMIEEAMGFGEPLSQKEIDEETKKANHFATIGIGIKGYYSFLG